MSKTTVRPIPALAALLLLAAPAIAHERWVRHELKSQFDHSLFDSPGVLNLSTLGGALLLAWLLTLLARRVGATGADHSAARMAPLAPLCLGVLTGLGLLGFAFEGRFLAPDLVPVNSLAGTLLTWGGGLVGVLLVLGLFARAAGWALLGLFVLALALRPFELYLGEPVLFEHVFYYLEIAGIAVYLGCMGRGALALDTLRPGTQEEAAPELRGFATGQLRLLLGATLIVLGLTKFVHPELPMGVIQNYADQIYEPIHAFTGISPEGYVLAASAVETTLGLLLVLGVFTRVLVTVALALFTLTAFIFQGEVIGHLPLAGVVLALLIDGGGSLRPAHAKMRGVAKTPAQPPAGAARTTRALLLLAALTLSLGAIGCEEATAADGASGPPPGSPPESSGGTPPIF